jgi:hypothetical protein
MGKLLMLQEADDQRIERLKRRLAIDHKVDVVRAGLDLLEEAADRKERAARWRRAATLVAAGSREVNAEFRAHSRLKRDQS